MENNKGLARQAQEYVVDPKSPYHDPSVVVEIDDDGDVVLFSENLEVYAIPTQVSFSLGMETFGDLVESSGALARVSGLIDALFRARGVPRWDLFGINFSILLPFSGDVAADKAREHYFSDTVERLGGFTKAGTKAEPAELAMSVLLGGAPTSREVTLRAKAQSILVEVDNRREHGGDGSMRFKQFALETANDSILGLSDFLAPLLGDSDLDADFLQSGIRSET